MSSVIAAAKSTLGLECVAINVTIVSHILYTYAESTLYARTMLLFQADRTPRIQLSMKIHQITALNT